MHFLAVSAALAALGSTVTAVPTARALSSAFYLQLSSSNATWDNQYLSTCHVGAAIEFLCPAGTTASQSFHFNKTTPQGSIPSHVAHYGQLIFELPSDGNKYPFPLALETDLSSNVAPAIFGGEDAAQDFAINQKGKLGAVVYQDDTSDPPKALPNGRMIQRWFVCPAISEAYEYQTLSWVYGQSTPDTPGCVSVSVARVAA